MLTRFHAGLIVLIAMTIVTLPAFAADVVVLKLKDGETIEGKIESETSRSYKVLLSNGASRTVSKARVESIEDKVMLSDEFKKRRAQVKDDDYTGRLEIVTWLRGIKTVESLTLAKQELGTMQDKSTTAKLLASIVDRELNELQESGEPKTTTEQKSETKKPTANPSRSSGGLGGAGEGDVPRLLGENEINRMKVFELNMKGPRPPIVVVPKETADKLFNNYANVLNEPRFLGGVSFAGTEGRRNFNTLEGFQQLDVIFELRARELYGEVIVRSEPPTLQFFRTRINTPYIMRYCGSCHSEGKAPGLNLVVGKSGDEAVAYTNLVILHLTETPAPPMLADGDPVPQPLILRQSPADSPLIQFGLPKEEAVVAHPEVEGWKPYFRTRNDTRLRQYTDWMSALTDIGDAMGDYDPKSPAPDKDASQD